MVYSRKIPIPKRFWEKVDKSSGLGSNGDCWEWRGCINEHGYGIFSIHPRCRLAHRVAWFITKGEWPKDCLLHSCDNTLCVRPDHLIDGDRIQNWQDARLKNRPWHNIAEFHRSKTHCPRGHAYDEANTYVMPNGGRACRACRRILTAVRWRKKHPIVRRRWQKKPI